MFIEAYLKGLTNMVESKSDLERLRFMPQKIEGGIVTDFKGNILFKDLDINDTIIFDANRVNDTKRFTAALSRDYFQGLDKVMPLFSRGAVDVTEANEELTVVEYGTDIYDAVAAGDKKHLRAILRVYKNTKWSGLEADAIEDATYDLNDCADDKDVKGAKEIVLALIGDDICEVGDEGEMQDVPTSNDKAPAKAREAANEDEAELLQDLDEAIADKDWEDVELLLKELGNKHPRYNEFAAKLPGNDETGEHVEVTVVDEICEDIEAALKDKDVDDAKKYLVELATEAGEDSDVYKEYAAKVTPPTTRRKRRG